MGCGGSKATATNWEKRLSSSTIASLEAKNSLPDQIEKRYGHPAADREAGYDFGIRVRVRGNKISIYVASAKATGVKVSLKECHLKFYSERSAVNETYVLADLCHESLPKLRAVFITDASLFMVMDYMDPARLKNFVDWRRHESSLTAIDIKQIMLSLANVVNYVHDKKYIIRNLNPENIMLQKDGDRYKVKLTDLSYVVPFGTTDSLADHPLFDWGDVPFTAPEALLNPVYTEAMDVWSLGVLLYLMLTCSMPFYHDDDKTLVHTIKMGAYSYDINCTVEEEARDLIAHMLVPDQYQRVTVKDVLRDPWLTR